MSTNNPFDLSSKTALVTGAGGGIGYAIATTLAGAGARIAAADLDAERAETCAQAIRDNDDAAIAFGADVSRPEGCNDLFAAAADALGSVDILINAAGIVSNTPAEEMPPAEWQRVLDVNLNGVFWCCQAAARSMLARGRGAIVNIASMNSCVANNPQPQAHYNASKAGVVMLTRSLAVEWAQRGVRVNAVSPGYIRTEMTAPGLAKPDWRETWTNMTPMGRVGQPSEIANAVWYLASDAASFTTGSNLIADGGYTCW